MTAADKTNLDNTVQGLANEITIELMPSMLFVQN